MSHFGTRLGQILTTEELNQVEFSRRSGLQPTYVNRLLKTARPITAATAAKIVEAVNPENRASLLTAFLDDELARLEAAREHVPATGSMPYTRLVRVAECNPQKPADLPAALRTKLRRFGKLAQSDRTFIHALEAFLDAMIQTAR